MLSKQKQTLKLENVGRMLKCYCLINTICVRCLCLKKHQVDFNFNCNKCGSLRLVLSGCEILSHVFPEFSVAQILGQNSEMFLFDEYHLCQMRLAEKHSADLNFNCDKYGSLRVGNVSVFVKYYPKFSPKFSVVQNLGKMLKYFCLMNTICVRCF